MRRLIRTYEVSRLGVQTQVGRSPFLYQLLHRLRSAPRSGNLVDPASDLCIEAPSGSGSPSKAARQRAIRPAVESHRLAPTATALYRRLLGAAQ